MSISPTLAKIIIQEHIHRPIKGNVLCLGRQTILMTHREAVNLIRNQGCEISKKDIKITRSLKDSGTRSGKDKEYISDVAFFRLLGITNIGNMDVSDYEGAEIIHDLNKPIPKKFEGKFDFIIDGGTFDHLFDLRTAFKNVTKMLKKNGRIFQWNAASNYVGSVYISLSPDIFYDFYVLNQFMDCKAWIAVSYGSKWNFYEFNGAHEPYRLKSKRRIMTVVLAEKGANTTLDKIPTQATYRDGASWESYKKGKKNISLSQRKPLYGHKNYSRFKPPLSTILRRATGKEFM
ncbi:MAG: class I SAM-dependent methyltransferase, partial [Parcubacteria group bacterium]|nr:class I SAM-dependent methyltransferase [Parcubacteria group bacterium]